MVMKRRRMMIRAVNQDHVSFMVPHVILEVLVKFIQQ
jgi:hypothetical protein